MDAAGVTDAPVSQDTPAVGLEVKTESQEAIAEKEAFRAWQAEKTRAENMTKLLAPLGGKESFDAGISKIQAAGDTEYLEQLNKELNDPVTSAAAISSMKTYLRVLDKSTPVSPKKEEPMFDNFLPGLGQSSATPVAQETADMTVDVQNKVSVSGIKNPSLKEAVAEMNKQIQTDLRSNPDGAEGMHLIIQKALHKNVYPLTQMEEKLGNKANAKEAIKFYQDVYFQAETQGLKAGDKTLHHISSNAKRDVFQASEMMRVASNGEKQGISYEKAYFG